MLTITQVDAFGAEPKHIGRNRFDFLIEVDAEARSAAQSAAIRVKLCGQAVTVLRAKLLA